MARWDYVRQSERIEADFSTWCTGREGPVNTAYGVVAIVLVCVVTLGIGAFGLRLSRTTSDFYVAGRTVTPYRNASAIGGEYLSPQAFSASPAWSTPTGLDMLWFPVGYTVGYVVLLVLVAAPLRSSGAYTLPDFAEARLESTGIRRLCWVLVVGIGWLYLLPQLQGAGLALTGVTGAPRWLGGVLVAVVVAANVAAGGMRSITLVQAVQYWIKLTAIAAPAFVLLGAWFGDGARARRSPRDRAGPSRSAALPARVIRSTRPTACCSPSPSGRWACRTCSSGSTPTPTAGPPAAPPSRSSPCSARSTFPAALRRARPGLPPRAPPGVAADTLVLRLPGICRTARARCSRPSSPAGAFAAFLSTASGLTMSVAGVIDQDLLRRRLGRVTGEDFTVAQGFRLATVLAVVVPYAASRLIEPVGLATMVELGVRRGGVDVLPAAGPRVLVAWAQHRRCRRRASSSAAAWRRPPSAPPSSPDRSRAGRRPARQPAAWSIPLAFATAVVVSLATPGRIPADTHATMVRLHTPEDLVLDRG